jgi:hypothetical protein
VIPGALGPVSQHIGPLQGGVNPLEDTPPCFLQIHLMGSDASRLLRRQEVSGLDDLANRAIVHEVLELVEGVIAQSPDYIVFQQAHARFTGIAEIEREVIVVDEQGRSTDQPQHGMNVSGEVAAIFDSSNITADRLTARHVVVFARPPDGEYFLREVSSLNAAYDPLGYPLLHPSGARGHHPQMMEVGERARPGKKLSQAVFYRHRLFTRDDRRMYNDPAPPGWEAEIRDIFHLGNRLSHIFWVDMFCKVEDARLTYLKLNQQQIRADLYGGVRDAIEDDADPAEHGRRVILPSTFNGSPRNYHERMQDALAIVAEEGPPALFITMTTNPKWPEITAALLPGQTAADRPDLVARVFRMRKDELMADIKAGMLGEYVGEIGVVEFQKRGLPHLHVVVFLTEPIRAEFWDTYVCAEIPDPDTDPQLHQTITTCNLHACGMGRCGAEVGNEDPNNCAVHYPKPFRNNTAVPEDAFRIEYRRRSPADGGRTFTDRRGKQWDNRSVVPYIACLSRKYDCHINGEVCTRTSAIKYLFKYIMKGEDRSRVVVRTTVTTTEDPRNRDEIEEFINGRVVTASEAVYKLFKFPIFSRSHTVCRLPVHMDGDQSMQYPADSRAGRQHAFHNARTTKLTAYFTLCNRHLRDTGERLDRTYVQVPHYYTWKTVGVGAARHSGWFPRTRTIKLASRIYSVPARSGDKFYLRLLLHHVQGAIGFEDLRTVAGVVHETYGDAAIDLGLVATDEEYDQALLETSLSGTAYQVRELFATLIVDAQPTDPMALWRRHADAMSDDFTYTRSRLAGLRSQAVSDADRVLGYAALCESVVDRGVTLAVAMLELPTVPTEAALGQTRTNWARLVHDFLTEATEEQLKLFDILNKATRMVPGENEEGDGPCIINVMAPAGCGKSRVLNALHAATKSRGQHLLMVGSTGKAAIELCDTATTAHKQFGIPVPTLFNTTSNINVGSVRAQLLRRAAGFCWDEALLAHNNWMQVVNRLLCDLHRLDPANSHRTPFANRVAVFANDGSQCLPVIPRGSRGDTLNATIYNAQFKDHMQTYTLSENMRAQNDPAWAEYLLRVGKAREPTLTHSLCQYDDVVRLPEEILSADGDESTLIEFVYGSLNPDDITNPEFLLGRTIMCPTVRECARLNAVILRDLIPGRATTHPCVDELLDTTGNRAMAPGGHWTLLNDRFPAEVLARLEPNGVPPAMLTFKKAMLLILTRNLRVSSGLCNGTRLILLDYTLHILKCQIVGGPSSGDTTYIPRTWSNVSDGTSAVAFRRRQFPVSPGYVTTIHRQQGTTLIRTGLWLTTSIFAHGLLYTALSRVGSSLNIKVSVKNIYGVQGTFPGVEGTFIRNVYYPEMDDLIGNRLQEYSAHVPGRTLDEHGVPDTINSSDDEIAQIRATHDAYVEAGITDRLQSRLDGCNARALELQDQIATFEADEAQGEPADFPRLGFRVMVCNMCGDGPVCSFPRSLTTAGLFTEVNCGACHVSSGLCHACYYSTASLCAACNEEAKTTHIDCGICLGTGLHPGAPCEYVAMVGQGHQFCVDCTPMIIATTNICPHCQAPMTGGRSNVAPPSYYTVQARTVLNTHGINQRTSTLQQLQRAIATLTEALATHLAHLND